MWSLSHTYWHWMSNLLDKHTFGHYTEAGVDIRFGSQRTWHLHSGQASAGGTWSLVHIGLAKRHTIHLEWISDK
jgi:hypothetical protein